MKTYYYIEITETREPLPEYDIIETEAVHLRLAICRTNNPADITEGAVYKTPDEARKAAEFLARQFKQHAAAYDTVELELYQ